MKEIIEQISQIDAVAYENEQKNKSILANERLRLENEMKNYRAQKLSSAEKNAQKAYTRIVEEAKKEYQAQQNRLKKLSVRLEETYFKVERNTINDLIEKLFKVDKQEKYGNLR